MKKQSQAYLRLISIASLSYVLIAFFVFGLFRIKEVSLTQLALTVFIPSVIFLFAVVFMLHKF
jgi:hypothetical protein